MSRSRRRQINLPPPYLKRLWLDENAEVDRSRYPFLLPFLRGGLDLSFDRPITIIIGDNGAGKSTLIEAIAALAGYDEAGGGKGYRPVDHARAIDRSGADLSKILRAAWLPKVTNGWFFKAETFFSVARYLDEAALDVGGGAPDYLSHSHGEGFLRFFEERLERGGLYLLDEPESALSPARQGDFLRLLDRIEKAQRSQIILVTHSPLIMACPNAALLRISAAGIAPIDLRETEHFRLYREFTADPESFVAGLLAS